MNHALRGLLALSLALVALAGCGQRRGGNDLAYRQAGGLSESRLPRGVVGNSPAPTAAVSIDRGLEAGWYKNAHPGEKAPSLGDHVAY